jgi:hypothetical protein
MTTTNEHNSSEPELTPAEVTMVASLTPAERFFYEHAGYCYDPKRETPCEGRVRCARELAAAEAWGKEYGVEFRWEWDESEARAGDHAEWCSDDDCTGHDVEWCLARLTDPDNGREWTASLCGIIDAGRTYRRVVETELTAEIRGDMATAYTKAMATGVGC